MPQRLVVRACALVLLGIAASAGVRANAVELNALTNDWPPYNYQEQNQIKGIATDILRAACQEAALRCNVQMMPWARAYNTALTHANTLVFTTARRPEREALFSWIGPILPRSTWVWARHDAVKRTQGSKTLADYRFGVVRGEASIPDLQAAGVPPQQITADNSNAAVLKLLSRGWVDAMVDTEIGMAWSIKTELAPHIELTKLAKLSDQGAYYFALNLQSEPLMTEKLQAAVDKLRRSGAIDEIVKRYTAR